ncbi:hypothetical protein F5050DRAFT_1772665 [Lentinula boryana]|uniref:Uncharacterized protein n=1 Tax=Lentinula boryana TaxID=40481 RepID=A0ABQ8Q880_9AGAR|nr:hypothetical protein F5050DRAFT_1772665 [Lentinula boryana]
MITNAPMMVLVLYFVLSPLDMRVRAGLYGVMAAPAQGYSHVGRTKMRKSFSSDLEREVESTMTTDKVSFHALITGDPLIGISRSNETSDTDFLPSLRSSLIQP